MEMSNTFHPAYAVVSGSNGDATPHPLSAALPLLLHRLDAVGFLLPSPLTPCLERLLELVQVAKNLIILPPLNYFNRLDLYMEQHLDLLMRDAS